MGAPRSTALCVHSDERHDFLPLHTSPLFFCLSVTAPIGGKPQIYIIISIKIISSLRVARAGWEEENDGGSSLPEPGAKHSGFVIMRGAAERCHHFMELALQLHCT